MPLYSFVEDATARMEVVGAADEIPPVQAEVQAIIDTAEGKPWPLDSLEHHTYDGRAKFAYCVIQTDERHFCGCFALTRDVIPPDA